MKKFLFILIFLPFYGFSQAQHQEKYWQQQVDSKIEVQLDEEKHYLHGFITITYYNNSPDSLNFIYFHLYPNAYKNNETAFNQQNIENGSTSFHFSDEEDRGYIDSLEFKVNGVEASISSTANLDVVKLNLPQTLSPGGNITISTPFRVKIPKTFSRLGHDGNSYQISQWFPKPAVYDKKGWHPMPYLDQGEFYSEFGSYDVKITLPESYIVMATGNLQNKNEIHWLDSLASLPIPDKSPTFKQKSTGENLKTLHFKEANIHDFAWFADRNWIVRKKIITLPEGLEVEAWSCYFHQHKTGWEESIQDIETAILGYSKKVGSYPYQTVKVVEGALTAGGGMEYPTVTVIASTNNRGTINTAIIHEVGHNWFYGVLGSNERAFPWMDEGINSFYESKLTHTDEGVSKILHGTSENYLAYALLAGTHSLQASNLSSEEYKYFNYAVDIYYKLPLYFYWLEQYMGADNFEKAMKDYFQLFKFKHPQPEDFERVFKAHATADISWFFTALSRAEGINFALKTARFRKNKVELEIKNKTGFPAPVLILLQGVDAQGERVVEKVWTTPFTNDTTFTVSLDTTSEIKWEDAKISSLIPDYRRSNDYSKSRFAVGALAGLDLRHKNKMWVAPSIGYNYYDGFMAGLLFHNLTFPERRIQFALSPMYGFHSKKLVGTGIIGHTVYPRKGAFQAIDLNLESKSFDHQWNDLNLSQGLSARFIKIAPELIFHLKKLTDRSPVNKSISLKSYFIQEEYLGLKPIQDSLNQPFISGTTTNYYGKVRYNYAKKTTLYPYDYSIEGQIGEKFSKISAEANFRVDYGFNKNALDARVYAGKMFYFDSNISGGRYDLTTTYTGLNDYLYDETFFSRNVSSVHGWHNQMSMKEGGFKVNTLSYPQPLEYSNNWLLAVNLKTDIPYFPLPFKVFADVATHSLATKNNPSGLALLYEAGLQVDFGKVASIYMPLLLSRDLEVYSKTELGKRRFLKMIGFSVNLSEINWLKIPSGVVDLI